MTIRALTIGGAAAALLAMPHAAEAAWGVVTGTSALNLRSCASVDCANVAVMPNGARVWIDGHSGGWYHLIYNDISGYASARYISATGAPAPAPVVKRTTPPTDSSSSDSSSDSSSSMGGGY